MSFYNFKKIWNPALYQGGKKKTNYFEGWYFKIADKSTLNTFSIIPSVSFGKFPNESKSTIQILDGKNSNSYNFDFNIEDFSFSKNVFEIKIGENYFSQDKLSININNNHHTIKAELFFRNLTPWPVTPLSPGVMGWYAFVPFMECYHGVLSLTHKIEGTLYKFATYTHTKLVNVSVYSDIVSICLRDKRQELQIEGKTKNTGKLLSPKNGIMEGEVLESLTSEVSIKLYEIVGEIKTLIYEDSGINTGMEIMWDSI